VTILGMGDTSTGLVMEADARLAEQVRGLGAWRMVFFAGLPGTGKSLLVHQLAHGCRAAGRRIHLFQWDVARPVFEASPAGRRYPLADGVTHAVIRKAAGLWARAALARWSEHHAAAEELLIGEAPFVGGRFIELAQPRDDPAETLLASAPVRFVVAVPSRDVRQFLEAQRAQRAGRPLHPREREDAPPHVLRDIWRDVVEVAQALGIAAPGVRPASGSGAMPVVIDNPPYDPEIYRRVYERVLRHRNTEIVPLDVILPTERLSVYDFAFAPLDLVPTEQEADAFIREAERRHPDSAALEREIVHWWMV
jgi:hypothetical protein